MICIPIFRHCQAEGKARLCKTKAKVQNCPEITILNSFFVHCHVNINGHGEGLEVVEVFKIALAAVDSR